MLVEEPLVLFLILVMESLMPYPFMKVNIIQKQWRIHSRLGFAMPHSILRNDVAGRDVTRYLKLLLRKEGYSFKTTAEFEIVKSIKERVCFLSPTAQKDENNPGDKSQFTLPDGTSIEVG